MRASASGSPSSGRSRAGVVETDPAEDGHAVPPALAVVHRLVAERGKASAGKAASASFVSCRQRTSGCDVGEPLLDPGEAGLERVHVPGGDAHAGDPIGPAVRTARAGRPAGPPEGRGWRPALGAPSWPAPSWPRPSAGAFLAAAFFLAGAFLAAPSWPAPSWLAAFFLAGAFLAAAFFCRRLLGRRLLRAAPSWPEPSSPAPSSPGPSWPAPSWPAAFFAGAFLAGAFFGRSLLGRGQSASLAWCWVRRPQLRRCLAGRGPAGRGRPGTGPGRCSVVAGRRLDDEGPRPPRPSAPRGRCGGRVGHERSGDVALRSRRRTYAPWEEKRRPASTSRPRGAR